MLKKIAIPVLALSLIVNVGVSKSLRAAQTVHLTRSATANNATPSMRTRPGQHK
jgi:hypothetical protein